jgi:hypothetical protein
MRQQAAPENGPRIMQVYRAALSLIWKMGAYLHHAPFTQSMLADSAKLELQDHVKTQGPLTLRRLLIERLTVVQRPVVANFRPDQ